jgi:hypothetical protein
MIPLTPSQARTLRLLTKNGQLRSFATSLVDDGHSRALRALVDNGYLTYEYTGTQRIYTLTAACGARFSPPLEGKTVAKKKTKEATNGHVDEGHNDPPADHHAVEKSQANVVPSISSAARAKKKQEEVSTTTPSMKNDDPPPVRTKSKPRAVHFNGPAPTLVDLLAVGEIATQHGGARKLLAQVALVDDLARKVGGIDRLRRALEGLETLAKLFK